ncbi:MAG: hypothetical protein OXI43_10045 [Candidatus Poribacteria bacterium]|nr:hypothetical protein [Candidatus Poribacteria bacterium]
MTRPIFIALCIILAVSPIPEGVASKPVLIPKVVEPHSKRYGIYYSLSLSKVSISTSMKVRRPKPRPRVPIQMPTLSDSQNTPLFADHITLSPIQTRAPKVLDINPNIPQTFRYQFIHSYFNQGHTYSDFIIFSECSVPPLPPAPPIIGPIADPFTDTPQKATSADIHNWLKRYIRRMNTYLSFYTYTLLI